MTAEIRMSDYYDGIYEVFNPLLIYEGNYGFPLRSLYECAKYDKGQNLVENYFNNNYLNEIYEILKDYKHLLGEIILLSDLNPNGNGRILRVSLEMLTQRVCFSLVGDMPDLNGDYSHYKDILVAFFKNYKKAISCLQRNEKNEELAKYISNIQNLYKRNEDFRKNLYGNKYFPLDFYEYLEKLRSKIVEFLVGYKRLVKICSKDIDLNELEKGLDLDKFYFMMAKQLMEMSKIVEQTEGKLPYFFSYVDVYINRLEALVESQNYDMTLNVLLIDGTIVRCNAKDLINEFNTMRNRHPEFKTLLLEKEEGIDYQDIEVFNNLLQKIETVMKSKELAVSWKLFKKGEREKKNDLGISVDKLPRIELSNDEKNSELRKRIDFFETSPYLYRVEGINNFSGYVGYIYGNGYVIFEKFYKNEDSFDLALGNATYIMNFANFVEMSKLSKLEIIEFIKKGSTEVFRRYHTSNWINNMKSIIYSDGYDVDMIKIIDSLIKSGSLEDKKVLH